jgi:amino acid adenylation domain-containing protein
MTTDSRKRLTQLSPEQLDLLRRRLAEAKRNAPDGASKLERRTKEAGDTVPLSFAQERAWFRDRLSPGDRARNISGAMRLEGRLSAGALSAALDEIVRRHETLRANFSAPAGDPVQTIAPPSRLHVGFVDLSNMEPAPRESEGQRLYAEETRRGFDLFRDRLLRATLIRLDSEEHLLLIAMHHIASDGWSIGVLAEELSALYTSFVQSREPDLRELPVRYSDFAAWQRQRMEAGALDRGLSYWRKQLENPPPVLGLRPDRRGLAAAPAREGDLNGATCFLRVEKELKQRLDELSRAEDTTLFTTLLASFMTLLMRCTGEQEIIVGSPVSGRTRVETERLIGLFVNTVALRARLSPEVTFREALRAVRQSVLDGLSHHEVPFERVVQGLDPERRSTSYPLFEILFNFTPSPPRVIELPGLLACYEEPPATGAEFPAQLYLTEWEDGLELRLVFQSDRYSESHMSCFLEQLLAILRQIVSDADCRLGSLDLTTSLSRSLLPNPSARLDEPAHEAVPHAIAGCAARAPEHPAICQGYASLTYAELWEGMAAVAEQLRATGLARGDVVAVQGPRSPGVVVCMAGTLLAGGVLLTLSTDLPDERRRVMLEESRARFLLYVGPRRDEDEWLREIQRLRVIDVDERGTVNVDTRDTVNDERSTVNDERDIVNDERRTVNNSQSPFDASSPGRRTTERRLAGDEGIPRGREGDQLPAYVFFTSGSTGKPKGVLGTHAGLAHFLDWQRKSFGVGPGDRCGQLTGLSFDVVLRDVFLALTSGATLVLPAEDDTASGDQTLHWLERENISLLHTVPSVAEMWLMNVPPRVTLAGLRRIFFAGEPLTSALVGRWRRAFPQAGEIVNLYGPTETTLAKCFYRVPTEPCEGVQPLGFTLPNTQALVLTQERKMCGIGEPGEIALRTPFRSLGYVNAPEENERRFIANPFGNEPDDRLYLTGDRGVYAADGLLEFLGRLDDQVKVRGVRVEPMEVALTLKNCPDVASCAVVVREDVTEGPALVAYVVPAKGFKENPDRLREFLRRRLPAPMLPSAFVFLDALPLTPNQKLDRARLPAPDRLRPELESGYLAPRDATELQLVQIWESLLNVNPIGIRDNFFALGGHSLMAMRLLMQTEQRLGKTIPLAAFFERPTIEHLAAVTRRSDDDEWRRVVMLWPAEHRLKLFLVHPGGGTTQNYFPLVRHLAAGVPVYGLQARGLDGKSDPHDDLRRMAADYVEEIRGLQPEGPYLLAGHSLGGVIAFEVARQLHERGQRVALLAMFDTTLSTSPRDESPAVQSHGAHDRDEDARTLADMAAAIGGFLGKEVGVSFEELRALSNDAQIERLVEALSRNDALPPGGGAELIRNLLNVNRAHVRARRSYRALPSPVSITLFRARDAQPSAQRPEEPDAPGDESLGWNAVSTEPVRVLRTPGDHVSMMAEPNVESLARALRSCLDEMLQSLATK